jgi:hypothetical protein
MSNSDDNDKKRPGAFAAPDKYEPKIGLKKKAGQKSMFEGKPKPQTPQEFQQKVEVVEEKKSGYKSRAADLFLQFSKAMADKTLPDNRNIFNLETEKEMLQQMIQLAVEINNDPNEQEGMGSLTWITCLFKTCLTQRDKINLLEFNLESMQKNLPAYIKKEIATALDKKKAGE